MKTEKQKIAQTVLLLRILQKDNNIFGNLKLQKEVFLSELNLLNSKLGGLYYKYFRYTFGPYSKELAETFKVLRNRGFVHKTTYTLTERGTYFVEFVEGVIANYKQNSKILDALDSTVAEYRKCNGYQLTNTVYNMKIAPHDFPNEKMKIKDIPIFCDILVPDKSQTRINLDIPSHILNDIKAELEMDSEYWDSILERNQDAVKRADRRLLSAIAN